MHEYVFFFSVSCYFVDPCKTNPCPYGDKCIPKRSLLLKNTSDCPQYLCVSDNDAMTNCRVHRNHRVSLISLFPSL